MRTSIYLINPREQYPYYHGTDVLRAWGISNRIAIADLTMPTVAAMVPSHWNITLCDERIEPVDFDTTAEVIGLTGKSSQRQRVVELAAEFRRRGKLVVIGGPYASLCPHDMREHADILVRGELEEIAAEIFAEIEAGNWKPEYEGGKPDLSTSPIPRWDLTRRGVALLGQVQTSRGCPFECDFCDVIQYLGRKQRWKEPDQVVAELEVLYARGFRGIFFADDNFTVMRRRARALAERLLTWNAERPAGRMLFSTQVSVDIARDPDLLRLCNEAGFGSVFIGIETSNEDSLAESQKRQNLRVDLATEVRKITAAGLLTFCGMIVGFDQDDEMIFERQAEFIGRLPSPIIQLNVLIAPHATPLYQRLKQEGRILDDDQTRSGTLLTTNIAPKLMSPASLFNGAKWLVNQVYSPAAFASRLEAFADCVETDGAEPKAAAVNVVSQALTRKLATFGSEERAMLARVDRIRSRRPDLANQIHWCLLYYCQARYLFETHGIWDPSLTRLSRPLAA